MPSPQQSHLTSYDMSAHIKWCEVTLPAFSNFGRFLTFIGRVARYTPSSRPKNASRIKENLEFHKISDDFIAKK